MDLLKSYIERMKEGNAAKLAEIFHEKAVLHDSSQIKIGRDPLHVEGRMGIEMVFHNRFGMNNGAFPITGVKYMGDNTVWYFISYNQKVVPVTAFLTEISEGKIKRLNIYPL